MGDVRYSRPYERVRHAQDPSQAILDLGDEEVVQALAAASRDDKDPYLANVLATEAMNRMRRARITHAHLAEGVLAIDASGVITSANPSAQRLLGRPRHRLVDVPFVEAVRPRALDGGAMPRCPILDALRKGEAREAEDVLFTRGDGSLLAVGYVSAPVVVDGSVEGAVVAFRDVTERRRIERERAALYAAEQEARRHAQAAEEQARVLAEAGRLLSASLDYEETLRNLASLLVPKLADWCAIYVLDEDGALRRVVVAHEDPGKALDVEELLRLYPARLDAPHGVGEAIRTGRTTLHADVPDDLLREFALDDEHLRRLRGLGMRSVVVAPLQARGAPLGAITLVSTGEAYEERDRLLAQEVAARAGLAIENALALRERDERRAELETLLSELPGGVVLVEAAGARVKLANEQAARMLGEWARVGDRFEPPPGSALVDEEGRPLDPRRWPAARSLAGEHVHGETLRVGEGPWARVSSAPLRDATGAVTGAVVVLDDVTDQREQQERLRRSEERYRSLFDHNPDAVFSIGEDGRFLALNPAAERLSGYSVEELVGEPFAPLLAEEDREEALRRFLRVLGGEPDAHDYALTRKDGERRIVHVSALPMTSEGRVVGLYGIAEDVTERRSVEAALAESEERHRLLIEGVRDYAIILLDPDGRVASWNSGAQRLTGWRADEVLGHGLDVFRPPEEGSRPWPGLETALREGRFEEEGWRVRKDGSRFWASVVLTALVDEQGRLRGFADVTRDLTERRRDEELLARRGRQQEALAQLGLSALRGDEPQALMEHAVRMLAESLDVELAKVLELEPSGETLLLRAGVGWSDEVVPGEGRVPSGKDSQAGYTLASDEPVVVRDLPAESRFRGPALLRDHGVRSGMSVVIHGARGFWGVLGVHTRRPREFTRSEVSFLQSVANVLGAALQRREAEREAQRQRERLEDEVEERTRELRRRNQELEAFSYSVAHDLRAPMRGIDHFSAVLEEDAAPRLSDEERRALALLRTEARRLSGLVNDLLNLSRVEHAELRLERVDVSAMAEDVLATLRRQQPARRVETVVEPGVRVLADARLLRVVLDNLLGNAWKFTARAPDARVALASRRDGDGRVWIDVRDNGAGFDPAQASRLFSAFNRLHAASEFEGTGVGLATVQRIVRRHGGEVAATGAPGKGATFSFTMQEAK